MWQLYKALINLAGIPINLDNLIKSAYLFCTTVLGRVLGYAYKEATFMGMAADNLVKL